MKWGVSLTRSAAPTTETGSAIDTFLHRPHPLLEGETPFDMARSSSAGTEAVLNLIRRAEAGMAL